MRPEDVREFLKHRPFQPFRITLTDGRSYDVMHPELALVGRSFVGVGLARPGDPEGVADRLVTSLCSTSCRSSRWNRWPRPRRAEPRALDSPRP